MALADVLRERVSRRGRTAEVACGLLGTVTVTYTHLTLPTIA